MRAAVLLILALSAASAIVGAEERKVPWQKSRLAAGQALYRENCVVCHDIDKPGTSKKPGPNFYRVFKNEKMPLSRMKPNRPYVITRIKFGGPVMPAFGKKMTDAEIAILLDYMESK